jgi:hypothetical protein
VAAMLNLRDVKFGGFAQISEACLFALHQCINSLSSVLVRDARRHRALGVNVNCISNRRNLDG